MRRTCSPTAFCLQRMRLRTALGVMRVLHIARKIGVLNNDTIDSFYDTIQAPCIQTKVGR